jgi:signal transduction histidine kinase
VLARLNLLLTGLLAVVLLALGIPLGEVLRGSMTHDMFVDRLNDTTRIAAAAAQSGYGEGLDPLALQLERYHAVYNVSAYVVDQSRSIRVASDAGQVPDDPRVSRLVVAALGGRHSETAADQWPWERRPMVIAEPIRRGGDVIGAVVTVSSTARLRDRVWRAWALLAAGGCALLIGGFSLSSRLARWVLRPVHDLSSVTNEMGSGRLDARVAAAGPPELRRLAMSFNAMADEVQHAIERQRAFVADASHQLRNPLTALIIRLDDLAARAPAHLQADAVHATEEGRRLAGMLERMLGLARAEHAGHEPVWQPIGPVVRKRVDAWSPVARSRDVSLRVETSIELSAVMVAQSVSEALDAILDNALKFAPGGSDVIIAGYREPLHAVICVRDFGPGLLPAELSRFGDRFWRSPAHQNVSGFGLGLSIVRALIEPWGGRLIPVLPTGRPGEGLEVRMLLPRAVAATASSAETTSVPPDAAAPVPSGSPPTDPSC